MEPVWCRRRPKDATNATHRRLEMEQNALTVIVPIKSDETAALEQLLTEIGEDVEGNNP